MARRKDRLEEWKLEIENSYGVRVTAIVKDLSREEAAREIYGELVCIPDADYRAIRCLAAHLPAACQADLIGRWQKSLIGQE